jgi:hypothetical protein
VPDNKQSESSWEEKFSKICSGIQSIAMTMAVIIGGVWTWHTFRALGEANRARAGIENIELQNANMKQKEGVINPRIEALQLRSPGDKSRYIAITVTLANVGTKNVRMCFEEPIEDKDQNRLISNCEENQHGKARPSTVPPINVTPVYFNPSSGEVDFGKPTFGEVIRPDVPLTKLRGFYIRAGQTESYSSVVRVKRAGLYRVSFSVRLPREETMLHFQKEETTVPRSLRPVWGASRFFVVK